MHINKQDNTIIKMSIDVWKQTLSHGIQMSITTSIVRNVQKSASRLNNEYIHYLYDMK